jgi:hypothetical protein
MRNPTPNPFPSGKGNRSVGSSLFSSGKGTQNGKSSCSLRQSLRGGVNCQLGRAGGWQIRVKIRDQVSSQLRITRVVPQVAPLQRVLAQIGQLAFGSVVADVG